MAKGMNHNSSSTPPRFPVTINRRQIDVTLTAMAFILVFFTIATGLLIFDWQEETKISSSVYFYGFIVFWIFFYLSHWMVRLFRLRNCKGPLFIISAEGVRDFRTRPATLLSWHDCKYIEWRGSHPNNQLRIIPSKRTLLYKFSALVGARPYSLPMQYVYLDRQNFIRFMEAEIPDKLVFS